MDNKYFNLIFHTVMNMGTMMSYAVKFITRLDQIWIYQGILVYV